MSWLHSLRGLFSSAGASDNRYDGRIRTHRKFRISWQDRRGKTRRKLVRVVDMSGSGALIECGVPLEPGSLVGIRTLEMGMTATACVRRCEPLLFTYQIGLQFRTPLTAEFR